MIITSEAGLETARRSTPTTASVTKSQQVIVVSSSLRLDLSTVSPASSLCLLLTTESVTRSQMGCPAREGHGDSR